MSSIASRAMTTLAAHTYLTKGIYEDDVRKEIRELAALIAHDRRLPAITLDAVILAEVQREVMGTSGLLALTALANTDDGEVAGEDGEEYGFVPTAEFYEGEVT